jgi:hypothetical protein
MSVAEVVVNDHLVTMVQQQLSDGASHVSSTTGNKYAHRLSPSSIEIYNLADSESLLPEPERPIFSRRRRKKFLSGCR